MAQLHHLRSAISLDRLAVPPVQRRASLRPCRSNGDNGAHLVQTTDSHQRQQSAHASEVAATRRLFLTAAACVLPSAASSSAAEASIEVLADEPGFGARAAQLGDLVLVHFTGSLVESGMVFDSTEGGLKYRDGGVGLYRPAVLRLGGAPVPGVCAGLQQALLGMRIGGRRTVQIPADLGFGSSLVLAPYAAVPGGSRLQYKLELLRLSALGPDELMKGINRCSAGGASEAADNCQSITPAEFF